MLDSLGGAGAMMNTAYGGDNFANPFADQASLAMPRGWRTALYLSEHLFLRDNTFAQAMERLISYFLTDIDFKDEDASEDEKANWEGFLTGDFDVYGALQNALRNFKCYGNEFSSIVVPFRRFMVCPKCSFIISLTEAYNNPQLKFNWSNLEFCATCPHCSKTGPWRLMDLEDDPEHKMYVKHWPVHEIELLHDLYTDQCDYLWRIPEDYKQQIRNGHLYHLERVPEPVLKAIRKNQWFRFDKDVIFHMKEPMIAGLRNRGWGIPLALRSFRQMFYVQVLRRYNEAIALDYVIPFRLLSPAPRPGSGGGGMVGATADPLLSFNMQDFSSAMSRMLRRRRTDPASFQISPYPVQFQMLGGDASKLAPVDLLNQGIETFLNDVSIPAELYKGTLQVQAAPVALRLFESVNRSMVHQANRWLDWVSKQAGMILKWQPLKPELTRTTMADDIQRQQMIEQLMIGGQVSGTTGLRSMGLDYKQENRRLGDEALFQADQQKKVQDTMAAAGYAADMAKGNLLPGPGGGPQQTGPGGQPPAAGGAGGGGGGAPPGSGGQPGAPPDPVGQYLASKNQSGQQLSPQEILETAQGMAQELLGTPAGLRRGQLNTLKQQDPTMSAAVKDQLSQIRSKARSQGGSSAMQQQFGPQAG